MLAEELMDILRAYPDARVQIVDGYDCIDNGHDIEDVYRLDSLTSQKQLFLFLKVKCRNA